MNEFYVGDRTGFFGLFWEIYRQERASSLKVQKRKEALSREKVIALIDPEAIRIKIQRRISALLKIEADAAEKHHYALRKVIDLNAPRTLEKARFNFLSDEEKGEFCLLKSKLEKTDEELIQEERLNIMTEPEMSDKAYLEEAKKQQIEHYKKWGSISYRGVGTGIGAVSGAILGTLLFPGLGTGVGAVLGGGVGGVLGLIVLGLMTNHFIVTRIIPLSHAYNQAVQIRKINKEISKREALKNTARMGPGPTEKKEAVLLAYRLRNIYKEVKDYILEKQSIESDSAILNKFCNTYFNTSQSMETNTLVWATIQNTIDNHYTYNRFTQPINKKQGLPPVAPKTVSAPQIPRRPSIKPTLGL
jgi:hypothetical protein